MSILIQDGATAASLSAVSEPEDLRGPDGKLLGRFYPNIVSTISFPEVGLTDQELARRLADSTALGHTADQVMARLRELDVCSR